MASIQEVADAAYRIRINTQTLQSRTLACANSLRNDGTRLAATVRGSRTGEDAVRRVQEAERAVRESAARLLSLQSDIDRFVRDLTK